MSVMDKAPRLETARLTGTEYREPPEPRELKRRAGRGDRRDARDNGRAAADDVGLRDERGETFVEQRIDAETRELIARQEEGYKKPLENAQATLEDAREQEQAGERELGLCQEDLDDAECEKEALGKRRGPSLLAYAAALVTVFFLNLPVDLGAAKLVPIPGAMRTLLAVLLGAGTTWMAHYAGHKIEDLRDAHRESDSDRFGLVQEAILLVVAIIVPVLVIVGTTIWRGETFAAAARATGGLVQSSAANIAFAAVALLAFAIAVIAALAYCRVKPLHLVQRRIKKIKKRMALLRRAIDQALRLQTLAHNTIEFLQARLHDRIQRLEQLADIRKARVNHNAARTEHHARKKQGRLISDTTATAAKDPRRNGHQDTTRGVIDWTDVD